MKVIYKYTLVPGKIKQGVSMPRGAEILTAQLQNGALCLWALVDIKNDSEERVIIVAPTGFVELRNNVEYIATFQLDGFVGHVFEET